MTSVFAVWLASDRTRKNKKEQERTPLTLEQILDQLTRCGCKAGCPVCVGPPMEVGDSGKQGVVRLLEHALAVKWDKAMAE